MSNSTEIQTEIESFISDQVQNGLLTPDTGIAISVINSKGSIYQGTFGLRNRNKKLPVSSKTIFPVSSSTKAFTSLAWLKLSEVNNVTLSNPLNQNQEQIKLLDPIASASASILDILSHRIGIPANDLLWLLSSFSNEELANRIQYLPALPEGFKKNFTYSNLLYSALEIPFKNLANENLESFITSKILRPLEMSATTFSTHEKFTTEDFASPYSGDHSMSFRSVENILPAGGLQSNLEDLNKWLRFLLLDAKNDYPMMLKSHNTVKEPQGFILQGLEWLGDFPDYGLGWFIGKMNGKQTFYHPGLIDGFSTLLLFSPEANLGISILINANLSSIPGLLAQKICNTLSGIAPRVRPEQSPTPPPPPSTTVADLPKTVQASAAALVGKYEDPAYGIIEILSVQQELHLKYGTHSWPLTFNDENNATFVVNVFGLQLPIPANFEITGKKATKVSIPFSLDPRVSMRNFLSC